MKSTNMNKIKTGDIVRIRKDSQYYEDSYPSNPKDINGKVTRDDQQPSSHIYHVQWDNGRGNDYREKDLELVKELQTDYQIY